MDKSKDEMVVPVFTGNPNFDANADTVTRSRLFAALHRINAIERITISPLIMNLDMPVKIPDFIKFIMGVGYQFQRKFVRDFFECIQKSPDALKNIRATENDAIKLFKIRKSEAIHSNYHEQNEGLFEDWSEDVIDGLYYICGICLDYSQYANKMRKQNSIPDPFIRFIKNIWKMTPEDRTVMDGMVRQYKLNAAEVTRALGSLPKQFHLETIGKNFSGMVKSHDAFSGAL